MIIFYEKETGKIFGKVNGRRHDENAIENAWLQPGHLKKKDIGKYVVPFKTTYKTVEKPVTELRVVDKKTMRVEEVQVGTKKVKENAGSIPDVKFKDLILDFESNKKNIYDYKVVLKKGKVAGIKKRKKK